ncbi:hypothetical protein HMPREF1548_05060 [Clostridium sp. KLE 1755]|nr:hypothetical protein HMPREF1548_05060 [Clostridium sp. KLE 1755]
MRIISKQEMEIFAKYMEKTVLSRMWTVFSIFLCPEVTQYPC